MRSPKGASTSISVWSKGNLPTFLNSSGSQPIRDYHEVTGDIICPSMVMGIDHLRDPRLNKVTYSIEFAY